MQEFEKFRQFRWRIYIGGPYSGRKQKDDPDVPAEINTNIQKARNTALRLAEMGYSWYCPHLNTCHFEQDCQLPHTHDAYLPPDFSWISCCDAIILTDGWEGSYGTTQEIEYAKSLNIPVFETLIDLDRHFKRIDGFISNHEYLQESRENGESRFRSWVREYEKIYNEYINKKLKQKDSSYGT